MEITNIDQIRAEPNPDIVLKTIFKNQIPGSGILKMGVVTIPPGVRVPLEGSGSHEGDEYSIVLRGDIKAVSDEKEYRLKKGQASFIPAGESHWALNDSQEECEIIWVLIEPEKK